MRKFFKVVFFCVFVLSMASLVILDRTYKGEMDLYRVYSPDLGNAKIHLLESEEVTFFIEGNPWVLKVDASSPKIPDVYIPGKEIERDVTVLFKNSCFYIKDGEASYKVVIKKPFYYGRETRVYYQPDGMWGGNNTIYVITEYTPKKGLLLLIWILRVIAGVSFLIFLCLIFLKKKQKS